MGRRAASLLKRLRARKRPLIISGIFLPTLFFLWNYDLIPEAWAFIESAGLVGWAFYMVVEWLVGRKDPRGQARVIAQELAKLDKTEAELAHIIRSLRTHYEGVIDRMEKQWDYYPRDSGEMIFLKSAMPAKTFGQKGPIVAHGYSSVPPNLEKDKMHLREFKEAWEIYSEGPRVYGYAKELEGETNRLVRSRLELSTNSLTKSISDILLAKFTGEIISRADSEYKGQFTRDFEAGVITIRDQNTPTWQSPAIDTEPLYGGKMEDAQKLARTMNEIRHSQDVKDIVGKRRDAWDAVLANRDEFLRVLKDMVIEPAKNSVYTDTRLTRGTCDDCRHLKERQLLLAPGSSTIF